MFSRAARQPERQGSTIAADAVVTGNVVVDGNLHVDGIVNGDVRCGRLTQGAGGAVHGNIVADDARLAGLVDGAVEARALVLEATARVTGDVLYESVGIAPGAEVEGRFRRRKDAGDHGAAAAREEVARSADHALPKEAPGMVPPVAVAATESGERAPRRGNRPAARPPELFAALSDPASAAEAAE